MNYKLKFNDGVGLFPVSLFIEITEKVMIFEMWDKIHEYTPCRDIIFHGNIKDNIEALNFLNSRLVANRFHTAVLLEDIDKDIIENLVSSRFIINFDSNVQNSTHFKQRVALMQQLSANDVVILSPKSLKEFLFTNQYLIERQIKAKIMLNIIKAWKEADISTQNLIDNEIYHMFLYWEDKDYV